MPTAKNKITPTGALAPDSCIVIQTTNTEMVSQENSVHTQNGQKLCAVSYHHPQNQAASGTSQSRTASVTGPQQRQHRLERVVRDACGSGAQQMQRYQVERQRRWRGIICVRSLDRAHTAAMKKKLISNTLCDEHDNILGWNVIFRVSISEILNNGKNKSCRACKE